MDYGRAGFKKLQERQLADKITELATNIQNGSVSIIKQDSVVIQINTKQKILIGPYNNGANVKLV